MTKSRSVVKNKLNKWYGWLVNLPLKTMKNKINDKNKVLGLIEKGKKKLKNIVEKEVEKEH